MARQQAPKKKPAARRAAEPHRLLIGTRKGGFLLEAARGRTGWKLSGPFVLGTQVHDLRMDPRDRRTLLMTAGLGHLGPTMYRSTNLGRKWTEISSPPRFHPLPKRSKKKREDGTSRGMAVKMNFWLEPGHADEPGVWYCGTGPQGLFRSEDRGDTWEGVDGFNLNARYADWSITEDGSPIGSLLHSILIDPRDPAHMYLSMSSGGTFESTDQGRSWAPLNKNVQVTFGPVEFPEYGQDPHCVILHPADPDRLFQQNHCGIYRLDRTAGSGDEWVRIGAKMPKRVGDIGFGVVGHPTDRDTVWVLPMDGTQIWPRTSPGGKPALYRTSNAGRSWERLDSGLPAQGWHTVLRQALTIDSDPKSPTLYFGTTSGEIWIGRNGGEKFECIAQHLPYVHSVRTVPRG